MPGDELPPLNTKLTADIGGLETGLLKGTALVQEFKAAISAEFGNGGVPIGERLGTDIGDGIGRGIQDADPGEKIATSTTERLRDERGRFVSAGQDVGAGLGDGLTQGVDPGLDDLDTKIKDRTRKTGEDAGKSTGQGFAAGASPLMIGAFGLAATAGPAVLLGATAAAVVGAGALITKNNAELTNSYTKLAADASDAITQATAPLVPAIGDSLRVLDQGIAQAKPQLDDLFTVAAPEATQMARGVTSLVNNALPGLVGGLRDAVPYGGQLADDFGKLGTGVGEFFAGLGTGAQGGATGLDALITTAQHLLGDIGQVTGALSNGLGPALHDVSDVAVPVADGLTNIVKAFPPGAIRTAADATALLYATFKAASLAGVLAEGTTFLGFLKGAATGEVALAGETGVLATAMEGLGTAATFATGPLGLLTVGLAATASGTADTSLVTAGLSGHTIELGKSVDDLTTHLQQAASGNAQVQDELTGMAQIMRSAGTSSKETAAGLAQLDDALVNVYKDNPGEATKEYTTLTKALGLSADDAAQKLPRYTAAIGQAKSATQDLSTATTAALTTGQRFTQSIIGQQQQLAQAAGAAALNTNAALTFAGVQSGLNQRLVDALGDYNLAKGAASAYGTALQALSGSYGSLQAAEATVDQNLTSLLQNQQQLGHSFTVGKGAGDQNIQMMNTYAQSVLSAAQAIVQQDVQTGRSSQATQDLTTYINQQRDAFVQQEAKILGSRDAAQKLFDKFIDIKNIGSIDIPITADTGAAYQKLNGLLQTIDSSVGYVQITGVGSTGAPGGKAYLPSKDEGGFIEGARNSPVLMVGHGREYVLSTRMLEGTQPIDPRVLGAMRSAMTGARVAAGSAGTGSAGGFSAAGSSAPVPVPVVNVYIDGRKLGSSISGGVRAEVQNFVRHNSLTGFVGVGQ